ncbi:hypothetical protein AM571_PC01650 (plasmid) [Rhizobium etli 8C-3]|uniref:Uncharacterized protein n=1 Tax=Rhizobium etli 8C-3 TaxID=538025 RepID=A0A1L5PGS6_RHIET|nr:hypothetical protein AM571_PC01650 [Rhizobium etli 8C-3]
MRSNVSSSDQQAVVLKVLARFFVQRRIGGQKDGRALSLKLQPLVVEPTRAGEGVTNPGCASNLTPK